jgi:nucleoside-triphosphatase THEP1
MTGASLLVTGKPGVDKNMFVERVWDELRAGIGYTIRECSILAAANLRGGV